jgi:DNA (cytosine-5)-methyltransferase 1
MRAIDLFSGVGGMELGFQSVGVETVAAFDFDRLVIPVHQRNFPETKAIQLDLAEASADQIRELSGLERPNLVYGGPPCFAAGTMVFTRDGYKRIETLVEGEMVLTHLGRWRQVTRVMTRGEARIREVRAGGIRIRTTDEHPFFVVERQTVWNKGTKHQDLYFSEPKWVLSKDLGRTHRAIQILPKDSSEDEHTPDFWWLVGNYLAEGWIHHRRKRGKEIDDGIILACNHKDVQEVVRRVKRAGYHAGPVPEGAVTKLHVAGRDLAKFLSQFGRGATNKLIPAWVFGLSPEKCESLLEGYLFGDGCVQPNGVGGTFEKATTVSKALALSIVLLAQKARGIVASISYTDRPKTHVIQGRVVNQNPTWITSIPKRNHINVMCGDFGLRFIRKNTLTDEYETVYNISVEEDESYVADGVVVHNCQAHSLIGKRDPGDPRRDLFVKAAELAVGLDTDYFVFENVPGILSGHALEVVDRAREIFEDAGYVMLDPVKLNAVDYGVPQLRKRVFFVGFKKGLVVPVDSEPLHRKHTVWEAIGDLPDVCDFDETLKPFGEPSDYVNLLNSCFPMNVPVFEKTGFLKTVHTPEVVARFDALGFGEKDKVSHASRLDPNGFSRTILASTGPEHGSHTGVRPIHPYLPRYISIREAARIQSFPDWFRFSPAKFNALRQIGNAVPPLLARAVALRVVQARDSQLPPGG